MNPFAAAHDYQLKSEGISLKFKIRMTVQINKVLHRMMHWHLFLEERISPGHAKEIEIDSLIGNLFIIKSPWYIIRTYAISPIRKISQDFLIHPSLPPYVK